MLGYIQIEYSFRQGPPITETYETTPELLTALVTRRLANVKVRIVERIPTVNGFGFNVRSHENDYPSEV